MDYSKLIIKFEQVAEQENGSIRRLTGFVKARYLVDLIDVADLQANPRSAKVGDITNDIIESIKKSEDIFPFKTKGILLAVTSYKELERNRFELQFRNDEMEGILDGGHNTLALALHFLNLATDNDRIVKKIKRWNDLKPIWLQLRNKVADIRDQLNFLVPVEILVPSNSDEATENVFLSAISEICSARNKNVQLPQDTKANQDGHYDFIKEILDPKISNEVVWKANEEGRIPVRDLIALSWIPLSVLSLPEDAPKASHIQIYSSKGKCVDAFIGLMENSRISEKTTSGYELKDEGVISALTLLKDLPRLYDKIYEMFPAAYNKSNGKFGRISSVRNFEPEKHTQDPKKNLKRQPTTSFYNKPVEYDYPEGFIMPLVCALSVLMEVNNGIVSWKVNPDKFLDKHLYSIVTHHKGVLEAFNWDSQKVGKGALSYSTAEQQFKLCLSGTNNIAA